MDAEVIQVSMIERSGLTVLCLLQGHCKLHSRNSLFFSLFFDSALKGGLKWLDDKPSFGRTSGCHVTVSGFSFDPSWAVMCLLAQIRVWPRPEFDKLDFRITRKSTGSTACTELVRLAAHQRHGHLLANHLARRYMARPNLS